MINNYIIATSGHIDHGKTALVKALSNTDCDTHKQEKERGITINLGFANIRYEDDICVSVIDVPGHKNFIDTMVSGVSCVRLALLVIAADSGVMPQTKEHIKILEALGISHVLIVLNKIDLVDPLLLEMAKEDLASFVSNTFIEKAPVFCVSSTTNEGIEILKKAILEKLLSIKDSVPFKSANSFFRMYVDRAFSLAGKGGIITGSIIDGSLHSDENLYLFKENIIETFKIKELQISGFKTENASFGNRVALNLKTNLDIACFKNCMISSTSLQQSSTMDVEIVMFPIDDYKGIVKADEYYNKTIFADFLIGTNFSKVKIRFLFKIDANKYFAQIYFSNLICAKYGDRFVIRNTSSDKTLGGGKIIDINPFKHVKRNNKLYSSLLKLTSGGIDYIIYNEIVKNSGIVGIKKLSQITNFSLKELSKLQESSMLVRIENCNNEVCFALKKLYDEHLQVIPKLIKKKHTLFPLSEEGLTIEEIIHSIDIASSKELKIYLESILYKLEANKTLSTYRDTWVIYGHSVIIDNKTLNDITYIEELFKNCDLNTPNVSEIEEKAFLKGIEKKKFTQILVHLVGSRKIYRIEDTYIHSSLVDNGRGKIISYLSANKNGITVASFRDIIDGNRKISLLLLAIYDRERLTVRNGDRRFLFLKI